MYVSFKSCIVYVGASVCVCIYMCVQICMYMRVGRYVCAHMRKPTMTLFLKNHLPRYFEIVSFTGLRLARKAWMDGQGAPGVCLSLPPQHGFYTYIPPHPAPPHGGSSCWHEKTSPTAIPPVHVQKGFDRAFAIFLTIIEAVASMTVRPEVAWAVLLFWFQGVNRMGGSLSL